MSILNYKKPIFENEKKRASNRVGVRFHPTEEEIINYFLHHKINGRDYLVDLDVQEIDLLRFNPKDIPDMVSGDGRLWYFFNRLEIKYSNSKRANRRTKGGFWKPTGKVRLIKDSYGVEIGGKRSVVYYEDGPATGLKPTKTDWIIDEYQVIRPESNLVLCKLKNKGIPLPRIPSNAIDVAATENQETQADIDVKHSFSEEQLPVTTCSSNQNTMSNLPDDVFNPTDFVNSLLNLENWPIPVDSEIEKQAQMDLKHSLSDEKLLVTTCSAGNENTALNLQNAREDDVDLIDLADSFLSLENWHYEKYFGETMKTVE